MLSPEAEALVIALRMEGPLDLEEAREATGLRDPGRFPAVVRELDSRGAGLTVFDPRTGRHRLTGAGVEAARAILAR